MFTEIKNFVGILGLALIWGAIAMWSFNYMMVDIWAQEAAIFSIPFLVSIIMVIASLSHESSRRLVLEIWFTVALVAAAALMVSIPFDLSWLFSLSLLAFLLGIATAFFAFLADHKQSTIRR